jgi:molecular chaperone GrpE (heat shock protein)
MNTAIEQQPQPRQPRTHFIAPHSRPPNGPAYTFGSGGGDEPPNVRSVVAELTFAMSVLVPALSRFLEESQAAHAGSQSLTKVTLGELRQQSAEFSKIHLSFSALAAAAADTRREVAELRREQDALAGTVTQLDTDVQLVGENQQKWTEEFIARHAADPQLAGYTVLLGNLWQQAASCDPALRPCFTAFADDVVRFLDSMNIELIRPAQGDRLDPHRHQPLSTVPTEDSGKHGCVAATYQPGLGRGPRIIQRARVAVFTHNPSAQTQTQCSERNTP